jgi:hypothetical protein
MTKHILTTFAALFVALLAACSSTTGSTTSTSSTTIASLLTSPAAQSVETAVLTEAVPTLSAILTKGEAADSADLAQVAYWAPWLQLMVTTFGSVAGVNPADLAAVSAAITDVGNAAAAPGANAGAVVAQLNTVLGDLQPILASLKS